ncbi:MAG: hypothetical protein MPJ25_03620, partial [Pirellulales bacterium]|nr:hypothetical protein [Pirellulales bacterium]
LSLEKKKTTRQQTQTRTDAARDAGKSVVSIGHTDQIRHRTEKSGCKTSKNAKQKSIHNVVNRVGLIPIY